MQKMARLVIQWPESHNFARGPITSPDISQIVCDPSIQTRTHLPIAPLRSTRTDSAVVSCWQLPSTHCPQRVAHCSLVHSVIGGSSYYCESGARARAAPRRDSTHGRTSGAIKSTALLLGLTAHYSKPDSKCRAPAAWLCLVMLCWAAFDALASANGYQPMCRFDSGV